MAFLKKGHLVLASVVRAPEDWFEAQASRGTLRIASKEATRIVEGYSPDEFVFTHNTIIASVDVDEEQDWMITAETQKYINDNKDSWERGVLANDWRSFIGAENYQEHVQIPSMSKGKIIDGAIRDVGDSLYVDILVATARLHRNLCNGILSGDVGAMSMGCVCDFTMCSRCGNRAVDEAQLCEHIKYAKGNVFIGPDGRQRTVAELCGHRDSPGSVKFIEASWVANPAFKGAVTRNILALPEIGRKSHQKKFFMPADLPQNHAALSKVAVYTQDDTLPPEATRDPSEKVDNAESFKEIENRLTEHGDEARRPFDIRRYDKKKFPVPMQFLEENIIHSSKEAFLSKYKESGMSESQLSRVQEGVRLFRQGGFETLARSGFQGVEILSVAYFLDRYRPQTANYQPIPMPHFAVVKKVGGLKPFASEMDFLKACTNELGRKFRSKDEAHQLLSLAKLFDLAA